LRDRAVHGRQQIQLVSPSEEAQMGVQAFQEIIGKATLSTDAPPMHWCSGWAAGSPR